MGGGARRRVRRAELHGSDAHASTPQETQCLNGMEVDATVCWSVCYCDVSMPTRAPARCYATPGCLRSARCLNGMEVDAHDAGGLPQVAAAPETVMVEAAAEPRQQSGPSGE